MSTEEDRRQTNYRKSTYVRVRGPNPDEIDWYDSSNEIPITEVMMCYNYIIRDSEHLVGDDLKYIEKRMKKDFMTHLEDRVKYALKYEVAISEFKDVIFHEREDSVSYQYWHSLIDMNGCYPLCKRVMFDIKLHILGYYRVGEASDIIIEELSESLEEAIETRE